ncbi:MAG: response regulator, partial [Pseudomonadota bacterium]
ELSIEDVDHVDEHILLRPGYDSYRPFPLAPGSYVMMSVTDSGSGIDPQILSHIFEPFYTTKPKGEGTGLGLAVVYGGVSQSGGAINVLTKPGHGSTFQIFIPTIIGSALQKAEQQATAGRGKGRILIIEDDDDVRVLIAEMLANAGYSVTEAANPREVLANLVSADVDLILTDVVMPDMGGPEFAQVWLDRHPEAKFLFMSGYFDEDRYPDQLSSQSLLLKPFKPAELITMIEQKLGAGQ